MADALKSELQKLKDRFSELYNSGEFKTLHSELFTEDAYVMPPGKKDIHESKEHENMFVNMNLFEHGGLLAFQTQDVLVTGPQYVLEWGTYDFHEQEGKRLDGGSFLMMNRKEDGNYKIFLNMWNRHD